MASSSSLTPRTTYDDDSDYEAAPPVVILFDGDSHPTVWDPTKDQIYVVSGRIGCEMTLPNETLLSVSLYLEQCIRPDRTGSVELVPLVDLTLLRSGGSISLSTVPNTVDEPNWTLYMEYYKFHDLPRTLHPQSTPCHFIKFRTSIPVGSKLFQDKGSGNITRSFRLFVESFTEYSTPGNLIRTRRVETGEDWFSVTVLNTRKIMGASTYVLRFDKCSSFGMPLDPVTELCNGRFTHWFVIKDKLRSHLGEGC